MGAAREVATGWRLKAGSGGLVVITEDLERGGQPRLKSKPRVNEVSVAYFRFQGATWERLLEAKNNAVIKITAWGDSPNSEVSKKWK